MVTSILAFEGNGVITHHVGGYSDYLEYKNRFNKPAPAHAISTSTPASEKSEQRTENKKFASKYKYELEKLPKKIEDLEKKIELLSIELSETEERNSSNLAHISMEIGKLQEELDRSEMRWLELEELKNL